MPINRTFVKQLNWGTTPTPNFMKIVLLESWLNLEAQPTTCFVFY